MNYSLPTCAEVRKTLEPLTLRQVHALAAMSGVPWSTVYKIKRGESKDCALDTARRILRYVRTARRC